MPTVAFDSAATNLVADDTNGVSDIFVFDRDNDTVQRVSNGLAGAESDGGSFRPSFSADGRFVTFDSLGTNLAPDDTNGFFDVFRLYELSGCTEESPPGK